MSGGLLQLVAYGAQDIYITGNPQITFFKMVYRRHTNFALETVEDTFDTDPDFGKTTSFTIKRKGDLLKKVYFRVVLNGVELEEGEKFAWTNFIGLAMINYVEFEIGGARINRQYGDWLFIWISLARNSNHNRGIAKILGAVPELVNYDNNGKPEYVLYIPLPIFTQQIPLISLQYHEVKINIKFNQKRQLIVANDKFLSGRGLKQVKIKKSSVLLDYVYLDSSERKKFAQAGHEYLIQEMQFHGADPAVDKINNYKLNFNHPTKEIVWATINGNYRTSKKFLFYVPGTERRWNSRETLSAASEKILRESILVINSSNNINHLSSLNIFPPNSSGTTKNGKINVFNNSTDKTVVVNTNSLVTGPLNMVDKIYANIFLDDNLAVDIVKTSITSRDLSVPSERFRDTRFERDDPRVNIFGNHGIFIDGSGNPVESATILFNGMERFSARDGNYFNYVQPHQAHANTPVDGINSYSFALEPEKLLASGSANLSRIDSVILQIIFKSVRDGFINLAPLNLDNRLIIFAYSYNIARIISGMFGLAFSN